MKRLGYLSAAPRVSTRLDAEASGPRAHVLGVIHAFKQLNWTVNPFIVGDRFSNQVAKNSERSITSNIFKTIAVDIVRLGLGFVNARRAERELRDQVDWVYERFAVFQTLGWIFKKKNIPWILETNGLIFYEATAERKSVFLSAIAKKIELSAYRECDILVCVSNTLKEIIVREAGISPDKVLLVPNGVDTTFFNQELYEPIHRYERFTLGFVGHLYAWQGIELLLNAVHKVRRDVINIQLVIVGDGPARKALEEQARRLNLTDHVTFTGRVAFDEIPKHIVSFDFGFSGQINLKSEKMYHSPLKLYEYMAMAKPVIASNFDDARKLVEGKGTGFLFEPGDIEDLQRVLKQAYENKAVMKEMGVKAREEIVANHSWVARMEYMISQAEKIIRIKYG